MTVLDRWHRVVARFTAWRVRWFGTHTQPPIEHCDWHPGQMSAWFGVRGSEEHYACEWCRVRLGESWTWQPIRRGSR